MPNIDPAALSRSDTILPSTSSSGGSSKVNGVSVPLSVKTTRISTTAQRIDLEPLYTSLKAVIGDNWANYKEAVSLFILGHLNQNELSLRIDHFVTSNSVTQHLHNQLLSAIYGNVIRDLPDQGVAPWVSANDKPTVLSKPVSGDAAEQRLKTEVMQLAARDRRRLKEVPDFGITDTVTHAIATSMTEYHLAKQIKLPDFVPASAGGLNKTNWDLEIRKRYSQPLASETGEFPDTDAIYGRMVPICYEESLPNGCSIPCAEFMATATEQYIKVVVSAILSRTRSNISGGNGIMTRKFRKQLAYEERGFTKGEVLRGIGTGLLPVEAREAGCRRGLGMGDLRLAVGIGGCELGQMPGVVKGIMGGWEEGVLEGWPRNGEAFNEEEEEMERCGARMNGIVTNGGYRPRDEFTEPDDGDWGWEGGGQADRAQLNMLLDEVLAVGS